MGLARVDRRALARLALAHHPTCLLFREDTFRIGRLAFCVGCFTAWPAIAVAAALLLWRGSVAPWSMWFGLGWILGSVQFVSVAGAARSRRAKVAVKACLGVGLAATLYAVSRAPWPVAGKAAFLAFGTILGAVSLWPKARRILATCDACMHRRDWEHCPGVGLLDGGSSLT